MSTIVGPIAPYSNVAIHADYYQPSRFQISAITRGRQTTITTSVDHNYVVQQLVRILIPNGYGSTTLNEAEGYVVSLPANNQVVVDIDSSFANAFIATPFTATITGITNAPQAVVTAANYFTPGTPISFSAITGMTQLNGVTAKVFSGNATSFVINYDTSSYSTYISGGTASSAVIGVNACVPQIMAIGDIGSGNINSSGTLNLNINIPGSFINISPN